MFWYIITVLLVLSIIKRWLIYKIQLLEWRCSPGHSRSHHSVLFAVFYAVFTSFLVISGAAGRCVCVRLQKNLFKKGQPTGFLGFWALLVYFIWMSSWEACSWIWVVIRIQKFFVVQHSWILLSFGDFLVCEVYTNAYLLSCVKSSHWWSC